MLERLAEGWSPEKVAGRFAREAGRKVISYESIYSFIYAQIARTKDYRWRHYLPRAKSKRGLRGRRGGSTVRLIEGRVSVAERLPAAAERTTAGHWEADTILYAKYGQAALAVLERRTRIILAIRPRERTAERVAQHLIRLLTPMPQELRQTISFDNGSEFAGHRKLHRLAIGTYFCDTYSPWEKGGVENAIGGLRRFLTRKTDHATLPEEHFRAGSAPTTTVSEVP